MAVPVSSIHPIRTLEKTKHISPPVPQRREGSGQLTHHLYPAQDKKYCIRTESVRASVRLDSHIYFGRTYVLPVDS